MHEMGIASSILEAAEKETRWYPGHRAAKIGVLIGEFAGVDTESLRFCFEVLAKGQTPAPLELDISWRTGSDELTLAYLEMEEVSDEQSGNREESLKRERSNCGAAA
ncbi:MAG TPA: hydrogenase maturation nickel metallochaperone HypA [Bryobacteraceae bacterium]|nr:hydrogenase maturation nickel metallochaperone HypA [Bryobacteraceae bacterium]